MPRCQNTTSKSARDANSNSNLHATQRIVMTRHGYVCCVFCLFNGSRRKLGWPCQRGRVRSRTRQYPGDTTRVFSLIAHVRGKEQQVCTTYWNLLDLFAKLMLCCGAAKVLQKSSRHRPFSSNAQHYAQRHRTSTSSLHRSQTPA